MKLKRNKETKKKKVYLWKGFEFFRFTKEVSSCDRLCPFGFDVEKCCKIRSIYGDCSKSGYFISKENYGIVMFNKRRF